MVRDAFWGGLLRGDGAPGQYWFWDRAYKDRLYAEFTRLSRILRSSQFALHPTAKLGLMEVRDGRSQD